MTPPTIVATPGAVNANSYVTVADADAYFGAVLYSTTWTTATATAKAQALITATYRLEQEEFVGVRADDDQALAWPRTGVRTERGATIPDDVIPVRVQWAQMKLALALLDENLLAPTGLEAFEMAQVDVIRVALKDSATVSSLPADVLRDLAPYRASGIATVRLRRS